MANSSIRAYERIDLPLEERLPSLARRFHALVTAEGTDPWDANALHNWAQAQKQDSPGRHAGLFLLNLWGPGPWDRFDAIAAVHSWKDQDRVMFANWARVWR